MPDNFIWTKHVQERSKQRGVGEGEVWSTLRYPDSQEKTTAGKFKFKKNIGGKQVILIASPEGGKWIILTTWVKNLNTPGIQKSQYSDSFIQKTVQKGVVGSVRLLGRLFWGRRKF